MKPKLYGCMGVLAGLMLAGLTGCSGDDAELAGADKQAVSTRTDELVSCTIKNLESGTLSDRLSEEMGDDAGNVQELIITGSFSLVDAEYLKTNLSDKLVKLDLTGVTVVQEYVGDSYDDDGNTIYHWEDCNYLSQFCFSSMSAMEEIALPECLTSLKAYAFYDCTALKEITIPDAVTSIGSNVFCNCIALQKVLLPSQLITLEECVFWNCYALETIKIPEKLKELSYCLFYNCTSLNGIEIPANITTIGEAAFAGCTSLTEITIPSTVVNMEDETFSGASSLTSVKMLANIEKVPEYCFAECVSLTDVELSSSVKSLESGAFQGCESLTQVSLITDYQIDGENVFKNTGYSDLDLTHLTVIPYGTFSCCKNLRRVTFSQNLTEIGEYAFDSSSLESVDLPEGLISIEFCAFNDTQLQSVTIPASLTSIGNKVFERCENLSSVIWKSALDVPDLGLGNNCLLYINTFNGTAPSFYYQLRNVIIDGVAESIVLKSQSNYAFGCPEAFTAKKISYTMDFPNRYVYTSQGKSSNWRTISLPFTPTKISHAEKGILAPFNSEVDDAKPFWLRSLTADGFEDVTEIEPNRAYIIAMPYNPNLYLDDYNISGSVTFEAENVEVPVTGELESSEGQDFVMYPTYTYMASSEDFYGMYHNYSSDESCFKTKQDVHPFEAYVTSATARSVISMTGKRSSTRAAADDPRLKQKGKPRIDDM